MRWLSISVAALALFRRVRLESSVSLRLVLAPAEEEGSADGEVSKLRASLALSGGTGSYERVQGI